MIIDLKYFLYVCWFKLCNNMQLLGRKILRFFLFTAVFLVVVLPLHAQTRIDSLRNQLEKAPRTQRVSLLIDMAYEYDRLIGEAEDSERENLISQFDRATYEALDAALSQEDNLQKARAHRIRGEYFKYINDFEGMFAWHVKALEFFKESGDISAYLKAIWELGILHSEIDPAYAIETFSNILSVDIHKVNRDSFLGIFQELGVNYYFKGNYKKSLEIFTEIYSKSNEVGDSSWIGKSLNMLGVTSYTSGDYNEALEYYMESLRLSERLQEKGQVARAMLNIGSVHKAIKSWETAKDYYLQALGIFEELEDKRSMASCFNNIGIIYEEANNLEEAEAYYNESVKLREELRDSVGLITNYINLGSLYKKNKEYRKAYNSYRRALIIAQRRGDRRRIALISNNIGDVYTEEGKYEEALPYFYRSLEISTELGIRDIIQLNYRGISLAHEKQGKTDEALKYFKQFYEVREELINEGNQKAIAEMQTKYDTEKKEQQIVLMNKDMELRDAIIKRDRFVKISMGVGIAFIFIFALYVAIQLQEKKRKNILLARQNDEIQKQKAEIENQRDLLAKQKQEITDSIKYARRIQKAILPQDEELQEIMPEHFVLFKPRDIVSGDFFWITKNNNRTFVVAADCTGHGVPGAFMSMLGVAFLNEIVLFHQRENAEEILNELRRFVKTTLGQTGKADEAKDGMDIALCVIDWDNRMIQYAGAYNPLFHFRNGELNEVKADKMPIGIHVKDQMSFTRNEFEYHKGDTFYLFSDGFVDQFGGEDGRKFMTKHFKQLLASIQDKPMPEQKEILDNTLTEWRGEHEQIDDVCVVGFRFTDIELKQQAQSDETM